MSKHKYTTAVCIAIVAVMLIATVAFMAGSPLDKMIVHKQPAYAEKLFRTNMVHTIDIVVKESDWDDMLANALAEEYIQCSVVIDGESVKGVGIRPKGNSSLSMIANSDSDRYSFKIEFDHYEKGKNYLGLDKMVLNNIAQDNTYMKDYVTYQMMNAMSVDAPLSSFIWVTVNGEDWGLYLAAEGVEESFAQRVYGNNFGEIYKPESMDMGDMRRGNVGERREGGFPGQGGNMPQIPNFNADNIPNFGNGQMPQRPGEDQGQGNNAGGRMPNFGGGGFGGFGGFGRFGGGATSLIYIDDNPESYSAIFDNAVFKPSEADKKRLIQSLKQLKEGQNVEQVVDVDEVIRYFTVHNFVLNSDSYTGSLTHNYYLAENNGKLSMIAWDYNLAFGGMGGGMGRMPFGFNANNEQTASVTSIDEATSLVNYPIDSPMLAGSTDDKPMIAWIFNNDKYLEQYHAVFAEYMEYFRSGRFTEMYDNAIALISPYVQKDPTAFCTYEEFQKGSNALREFCLLRAESIQGQLNGTIASTSDGQTASGNAGFIDASSIDIKSMGSNSMGFGRARNGGNFTPPNGQGGFPNNDGNFTPTNEQDVFPGNDNFMEREVPNTETQNPENNAGRRFPNMAANSDRASKESSSSVKEAVLLLACAVVLVGGIVFAKKY